MKSSKPSLLVEFPNAYRGAIGALFCPKRVLYERIICGGMRSDCLYLNFACLSTCESGTFNLKAEVAISDPLLYDNLSQGNVLYGRSLCLFISFCMPLTNCINKRPWSVGYLKVSLVRSPGDSKNMVQTHDN